MMTMIDTNIKGLLTVTRQLLPQMVENNEGHIINIGSTAGIYAYAGVLSIRNQISCQGAFRRDPY